MWYRAENDGINTVRAVTLKNLAALCGVLAVMAGCVDRGASDYSGAPSNPDNICAIFEERRGWREAAEASSRRWNAPVAIQMAVMWRESSFRGEARTQKKYVLGFIPNGRISSAYGYAQAIDGTWDWYVTETGNSRARRNDFDDAIDFIGWYLAKTRSSNGIGPNDAYNHYLAYHEGHTGYRRGSYHQKPWLTKAATQVAAQAARYRGQLSRCS